MPLIYTIEYITHRIAIPQVPVLQLSYSQKGSEIKPSQQPQYLTKGDGSVKHHAAPIPRTAITA